MLRYKLNSVLVNEVPEVRFRDMNQSDSIKFSVMPLTIYIVKTCRRIVTKDKNISQNRLPHDPWLHVFLLTILIKGLGSEVWNISDTNTIKPLAITYIRNIIIVITDKIYIHLLLHRSHLHKWNYLHIWPLDINSHPHIGKVGTFREN